MAWVLGLLHSSASLSGTTAAVRWEAADVEVVEKVRACLESTHPISVRRNPINKLLTYHCLTIARQWLRAGIDTHVPVRLQAERTQVPDVPADLFRHFARGYSEGSGSMSFLEQNSVGLQIRFTGHTALLADLRERLRLAGLEVPGSMYRASQVKDTSMMVFTSRRGFRLAEFLYRDAPASLSVDRRRANYLRALEWRTSRGLEVADVG